MGLLFKNNAETTLSGGINDSVTTVPVTSAAVFPTPDANNVFFATIDDGTNVETVKVTGISSNDLTVVREQDNTSAAAFSSGAKIELRLNAKVLDMGTGSLTDLDGDTKIQVEESADEDIIRFDVGGSEKATLNSSGVLDVDGGITIDNITIDGTEIDLSSGDLTLDVEGDIILDANGADIIFKDDGTEIGRFSHSASDLKIDSAGDIVFDASGADFVFADDGTSIGSLFNSSTDFVIKSLVDDKDIIMQGKDGSSTITALTLDMSEEGDATFNNNIKFGDNGKAIFGAGTDLALFSDGTDGKIEASGDLILDAGGEHIRLKDDGTEIGNIDMGSQNLNIRSTVSDKDIQFLGNDGGSEITALTLDMSAAGAATFNDNVTAYSDERLKDNIETLTDGLDKVEQLRGVTYTRDERENIGVIAQEVEKILPEIVLTADDEMGTKSVDYSRLTAVLIEAVKDLSARVKELEDK